MSDLNLDDLIKDLESKETDLYSHYQTIFVFSHMRAHTTLFCHLLANHPDIMGYAEMFQSYYTSEDLIKLRLGIQKYNKGVVGGRYLLDKLLFNNLIVDSSLLEREDVHTIFLLRKPEASLKSIVHMKNKIIDENNKVASACKYYINRLSYLNRQSAEMDKDFLFLEVEPLIDKSERSLQLVQSFLGLEAPLSSEYSVYDYSGHGNVGDGSKYIRRGSIVKKRRQYPELELSTSQSESVQKAYEQCHQTLKAGCSVTI